MSEYTDQLQAKLESARKRVAEGNSVRQLKSSSPMLFEIIDTEISLAVNRAFAEKPLSLEDYLSAHGEVRGIKRIRNLLDSKEAEAVQAHQEVTAIEGNLKQLKDDQKRK